MCDERRDWREGPRYRDNGPGWGPPPWERRDFGPPHWGERREWGPPPGERIHIPSNMIGPLPRHFVSNEEFLEFLKWYKSELEKELKGVTEAIEELKRVVNPEPASNNQNM